MLYTYYYTSPICTNFPYLTQSPLPKIKNHYLPIPYTHHLPIANTYHLATPTHTTYPYPTHMASPYSTPYTSNLSCHSTPTTYQQQHFTHTLHRRGLLILYISPTHTLRITYSEPYTIPIHSLHATCMLPNTPYTLSKPPSL